MLRIRSEMQVTLVGPKRFDHWKGLNNGASNAMLNRL